MNISHLRYAIEVEKTRSITLTADNLYMRQPNLSKAIKELEGVLGFQIFIRSSQGVIPTKKGSEFLLYAKAIIKQIDEMESMYCIDTKNRIMFSLSAPKIAYINQAFINLLNRLEVGKELDINFIETDSMKTINNVLSGEYNLGVIQYQQQHEKVFLRMLDEKMLVHDEVAECGYVVLMSKNNQLVNSDKIDFKDLRYHMEILCGDVDIPTLSTVELKKEQDIHQTKRKLYVYERQSQLDILSLVKNTYMLTFPVDRLTLEKYGLVQRRCNVSSNMYKNVLIYNKDYKLSDIDQYFICELKSVWQEISKTYI